MFEVGVATSKTPKIAGIFGSRSAFRHLNSLFEFIDKVSKGAVVPFLIEIIEPSVKAFTPRNLEFVIVTPRVRVFPEL